MAKLNNEIFTEIIERIGETETDVSNSGAVFNFMLSGKEPFYAALNYFSKADKIIFRGWTFDICVKKNIHCFGYDNGELTNRILEVCIPSIKHLCVYECPQNSDGYGIFDKCLKTDLKELTLFAALPRRYFQYFQTKCNFKTVNSHHLIRPTHREVLMIPSETHKLVLINNYNEFINEICVRSQYPNVKKLIIEPCVFSQLSYYYLQVFKASTFPNLEFLDIKFDIKMIEAFEIMTSFSPSILRQMAPKVKGMISFKTSTWKIDIIAGFLMKNVPNLLIDETSFTKMYQIHDGFSVNCKVEFEPEDVVEASEAESNDDDDSRTFLEAASSVDEREVE